MLAESKELVGRLLGSDVKVELLMLFHKNPGLIDSPEGVALRIGRKGSDIEEALRDFIDLGLLVEKGHAESRRISLNRKRDREIQKLIVKHIQDSTLREKEVK